MKPTPRVWAAAAASILLVLVIGVWLTTRSGDDETIAAETEPAVLATATEVESTDPGVPTFGLLVEASPWGEIVEIQNEAGEVLAAPEVPFTPLQLSLPSGTYSVRVRDPQSELVQTCEVMVGGGKQATCQTIFSRLDPIDYFKEAGWWD